MTGSRPPAGPAGHGLAAMLMLAALSGCSDDAGSAPRPQGPDNTAITAPTTTPTSPPETSPTTDAGPTGSGGAAGPDRPATPRVAGVVARDLEVPWGIDFLPDGSALVAERDNARILRIHPSGRVTPVGSVSGVVPTSEGGLLGLAVSPTYEQDHRIYVYFTTSRDNRVVSMTY